VRMQDLKIGDVVRTGTGNLGSPIFIFSHADPTIQSEFVQMTTSFGQRLTLTPTHILYCNGRNLTAARDVRLGDMLEAATSFGSNATMVTHIEYVQSKGLYNPHTLHGDIVVDGIVTTTFTTAVEPRLAQTLLAPFRLLYRIGVPTRPFNLPRGSNTWIARRLGVTWFLSDRHV
jgi:Hint module